MSESAGRVADATGNWVDSLAPSYSRPYLRLARLDRPIGSWLLLMPCWWSVGIAGMHNGHFPSLWHIVLFFIGAFAMRGAGCTWNDLVDRDLDGLVERTRSRPIPSKQVTIAQATAFMLAQALIGLLVLIGFAGLMADGGFIFALGLIGFGAHLAWQVARLDIDDPAHCLVLFKSNRDAGLILFGAMLIEAA